MEYIPYKRNTRNISNDNILDITEYTVTAAGMMGVDTTMADVVLCTAQASRLLFTPNNVEKPKNEQAKLIASGASIILGTITGNKRTASALEMVAMGIIDSTINE